MIGVTNRAERSVVYFENNIQPAAGARLTSASFEAFPPGARSPRLLLLPGFLSSSAAWNSVAASLHTDAIAVSCDLPGFGMRAPQPSDFSLAAVVEAIRPTVEAFEPTHIVGHSMGGILGLAIAAAYPQVSGVGAVGLPVFRSAAEGVAFIGRRGQLFRRLLRHGTLAHSACVAAQT